MEESKSKKRIDEIIDVIMKVAAGDYTAQVNITQEFDYMDALGIGINMMIDDIRTSFNMKLENERINLLNEQLQIAKAKAEESDRLKSAFLANMSHEIRTPMNGIMGFAELLKDPFLTGEQQYEYIKIIEKSGVRMLNIINDIIDISKIEAGLMNITLTTTCINEQMEYIYAFFKPEVDEKGLHLSFKNPLPTSKSMIITDQEKFYAILTNLVKNAIKYTESGAIEFGYTLNQPNRPTELIFYVKDTGIGIPSDRQAVIFERFIQADLENKRAIQGAGLGLAITKAYVEMLGGKIWLESDPDSHREGKGSTFYFTLPYNVETPVKAEKEIVSKSKDKAETKKSLKVLIAEDDETSEMLITLMIRNFSREVLTAKTGAEAVEKCKQNPDIDLILMDIRLPVMDGYEATRLIRQFNEKVVIIAQTAYGLAGDKELSIEAGCNTHLSKPIDKEELDQVIQYYFKD
ncbi:MAG: ATP-binding protein [Bacteroidales bacterium]|jgi:hypothetical protein